MMNFMKVLVPKNLKIFLNFIIIQSNFSRENLLVQQIRMFKIYYSLLISYKTMKDGQLCLIIFKKELNL